VFRLQEIPKDGDPSEMIQEFEEVLPRLLCCRYWWLTEWKSQQMSFPYWRMYWNRTPGATVVYKKTISLDPDKIILIPPNTPFSSDIIGSMVDDTRPYSLKGGRVDGRKMEQEMLEKGIILHLFIHFTLGYSYDTVSPGIHQFDITPLQENLVSALTDKLMARSMMFDQATSLEVYNLLFSVLNQLPQDTWKRKSLDGRVVNGIRYMEKNIHSTSMKNRSLAELGHMSVNSFTRLFKKETGYSPRKYLLRMRIEKACNLLHHSDMSIDQIASSCGFSDRYYFTRIFTRTMKVSPGIYRKNTMLKY
jgi:AraC-like DNA-binding protein